MCFRLFARCRLLNGGDNTPVCSATADVSVHAPDDILFAVIGRAVKQSHSRHDHPGCAISAREGFLFEECLQKMHSAFDKMKGNVGSISNADEKARWQANVDMWQTVVDHHDQMLKHMEDAQAKGMGCGMELPRSTDGGVTS